MLWDANTPIKCGWMILDSEGRYSKDNLDYHTKYGNVNTIMNFTRTPCGEVLAHFCFFWPILTGISILPGLKMWMKGCNTNFQRNWVGLCRTRFNVKSHRGIRNLQKQSLIAFSPDTPLVKQTKADRSWSLFACHVGWFYLPWRTSIGFRESNGVEVIQQDF